MLYNLLIEIYNNDEYYDSYNFNKFIIINFQKILIIFFNLLIIVQGKITK